MCVNVVKPWSRSDGRLPFFKVTVRLTLNINLLLEYIYLYGFFFHLSSKEHRRQIECFCRSFFLSRVTYSSNFRVQLSGSSYMNVFTFRSNMILRGKWHLFYFWRKCVLKMRKSIYIYRFYWLQSSFSILSKRYTLHGWAIDFFMKSG